jgi:hypothetical protein
MWVGIILSLRQELMVTVIIFLLLFVKVGATEYKTGVVLNWVNVLLLANFVLGFFPVSDATLFSGMFHTNKTDRAGEEYPQPGHADRFAAGL